MTDLEAATAAFHAHHDLVRTIAREILGSTADTEDVVQETWLRWTHVAVQHETDHRATLVRIATRQCLARLREGAEVGGSPRADRPSQTLLTPFGESTDVALADLAVTRTRQVLDALTPTERAAFLLTTVFGVECAEIASAVGLGPADVVRMVRRIRAETAAHRPPPLSSPAQSHAAFEQVRRALESGDRRGLRGALGPGVVVVDGGDTGSAARSPAVGADEAEHLIRSLSDGAGTVSADPVRIEGHPALVIEADGHARGVLAVVIDRGTITGLYHSPAPSSVDLSA